MLFGSLVTKQVRKYILEMRWSIEICAIKFFLRNLPSQTQAEIALVRMCWLIDVAPAPSCLCFTQRPSAVLSRGEVEKTQELWLSCWFIAPAALCSAFPASQAFLALFNMTPRPIAALLNLILSSSWAYLKLSSALSLARCCCSILPGKSPQ